MSSETTIDGTVTVLRIIIVAMVMGVVAFGLFVVFGSDALNPAQPPAGPLMTCYIAAGFAAVMFVLHLVIPTLIARQSIKNSNGSQQALVGAYLTKTLVAVALLEGAAFYNLFALMSEHQWWSLAIAGGLVFWMLARFPSRTSVEHWVEAQQF